MRISIFVSAIFG